MEVIKNKRVLALVGVICLILGCFLPYYTVSFWGYSESVSLWGYWEGKVVLVLTLANILFIFQDFVEKYVPRLFNNWVGNLVQKAKNPKFALVPTILVAVFAISLMLDVDFEYIKFGLGFWVLWIGIIALIGHAIFYKKQNAQLAQQTVNYQQVQQPQQTVNYQQAQQPQQTVNYQQAQQPQQTVNYQQAQQPQQTVNYQQAQQPQQTVNYQQMGQPVQPTTVQTKKVCPHCRNQVDVNAETCFMCGGKF